MASAASTTANLTLPHWVSWNTCVTAQAEKANGYDEAELFYLGEEFCSICRYPRKLQEVVESFPLS